MGYAYRVLQDHHVNVVGFHELQPQQPEKFNRLTGKRWAVGGVPRGPLRAHRDAQLDRARQKGLDWIFGTRYITFAPAEHALTQGGRVVA